MKYSGWKRLLGMVLAAVMVLCAVHAAAVVVTIPDAENLPLWFRHWYLEDDPDTMLSFDAFYGSVAHMKMHWQGYGDIDCCPEFSNGSMAGFSDYITYVGGVDRPYDLISGTMVVSRGADGRDRLILQIQGGSAQDPRCPFYADYEARGWTFTFVTDEEAQPLDDHLFDDFFRTDGDPEDGSGDVPEIGSGIDRVFGDFGFSELTGLEMLAASGAGAWGGYLCFEADGSFRGDYYDTDYDPYTDMPVTESVTFTGRLTNPEKVSDTVYRFTVTDVTTQQTPGEQITDEYGETYVFVDALFPEGSTALLTLPGTPEDQIPEAVTIEFYGCYPGASISDFVTLTREDGWGFFEMPEDDLP